MIAHLSSGFENLGVITTETDGKWYVSPVRTVLDLGPTLMSGLTAQDAQALIHAGMLRAPMSVVGGGSGGGGIATPIPSAVMSPSPTR